MPNDPFFDPLVTFLERAPAVQKGFGSGDEETGWWWVKFSIDIDDPLAWRVVQELGHVLNYLSLKDRLPTVFKPVSPPPYLNGGPAEFLSWVIECHDRRCSPLMVASILEGRLPRPIDDRSQWPVDGDD